MADENKNYDLDAYLDELQEKNRQAQAEAQAKEHAQEEDVHVAKKPVFELHLDLDSEYGEAVETAPIVREEKIVPEEPVAPVTAQTPVVHTKKRRMSKQDEQSIGCLKALVYAVGILMSAVMLAVITTVAFLDYTGLGRVDRTEVITIPEGASTETVTNLLEQNNMVEYPFIFRVYVKLNRADGKWQHGEFELAPNMGYKLLIENLQAAKPSETLTVTIPEGFTIDKIAKRLEEKKVCSAKEFYRAVTEVDYSNEYDFLREAQDAPGYANRMYKLEGYLFPDTYQFYENSSGEAVVRRFLDNFANRLDTSVRSAMSARDMTMNELIVLASVVQGEAASRSDMQKVARVLDNRLQNKSAFPKLQCDSTRDYVTKLADKQLAAAGMAYYNTYEVDGLPAGPINNPGMDAIRAVLVPWEEASVEGCYYFATDYDTGITYFSRTYEQHVSICKRYGIGMYG